MAQLPPVPREAPSHMQRSNESSGDKGSLAGLRGVASLAFACDSWELLFWLATSKFAVCRAI